MISCIISERNNVYMVEFIEVITIFRYVDVMQLSDGI